MKTRIIEATQGLNWGKFLLAIFDTEMGYASRMSGMRLLPSIGWDVRHFWMLDLQTCEGAAFAPTGYGKADLEKHAVLVCPLYEPTLNALRRIAAENGGRLDLNALPDVLHLLPEDAPFEMYGHRRPGPRGVRLRVALEELRQDESAHTDDCQMQRLGLNEPCDCGVAARNEIIDAALGGEQ